MAGAEVVASASDGYRVQLAGLTVESTGRYRCEVRKAFLPFLCNAAMDCGR